MSYLVTTPEWVTAAAGDLASINSVLQEAARAASAPTTGISAAAADEVSAAVSRLFGGFGQEFQAVSAQVSSYHADFLRLLDGSAAAYVSAEIANAGQVLAGAVSAPSAAAAVPGGAYGQLVANTATNLQALGSSWAAHPFPLLSQIIANQQRYFQQLATAIAGTIQNFPAALANLPTAIQQFLTAPWAQYTQQFITSQIGFAQAFLGSLNNAATGLVAGLPAFRSGLEVAFQAALAGDYFGAAQDAGSAFGKLLITGFDVSNYTVNVTAGVPITNVTATAFPKALGPLPDFFNAIGVLGQDAQYLTNLMPPGTIPRQISQNFTNIFNTLSNPSIEALATLSINLQSLTATGTLSGFFGLPVVLTYASVGAPINSLFGMATSATAIQQALSTGNYLGALGAVVDAPAVVTNSFLNGQVIENVPIAVPLPPPFAQPLPTEVLITLHLPIDGLLVPPHTLTATVSTNSQIPIPGLPFDATIFGTPFMGLAPLLTSYLPQQFALAITPPG